MKLSQLRALVAVADHKSFSEAALELELSQSAVSHAIAGLEEELGVPLFLRGRHGAALTPVGERVSNHARQVLQLLDGIEKEANLAKSLQGGQVRIGAFRSVATHVLPAVIARFRRYFPEIIVIITEYADYLGVEQALRVGQADIGFTYLPASEEFETWEILRDEYVVLLPPATELTSPSLTWKQLSAYPLVLPTLSLACYVPLHQHLMKLSKFPLNAAYEVTEDSTIVSMVVQGLGVGILPYLAAKPIPAEVKVCSLPVPCERVIGVAALANALQVPAIFAFLDALRRTGRFKFEHNSA
jgi:DNA-binding transcriptional LysR family regulator